MPDIKIIPVSEFERVRAGIPDWQERLAILADMNRLNTLASVKRAGSGHLGTSFSSLDIVTYLYEVELNTLRLGFDHPDRDVYFSSKGHDVPGFYAVMYSLGVLHKEQLIRLRRIDGTCGHPDVSTPGVEANSGSLGMGVSKAKGMALAKRLLSRSGRVIVMTGDGELQEGQIYESLQVAAHQRVGNLHVIVDRNEVQSDKPVAEICDLSDIERKFEAFGWHVSRCDGHDPVSLSTVFRDWAGIADQPKILVADTVKGRGVSFMEHPAALAAGGGLYRWHSGAPDDASYEAAFTELASRINTRLRTASLEPLALDPVPPEPRTTSGVSREYVAAAYGKALVELAATHRELVVVDADLAADCRIREFEDAYPERFVECGIAEQDMVSTAGGLARQGLLPVVNSFAAFLVSRANEQIYNNATERSRIIYGLHYSGLIPAGPGQSHQSIRDISLLGALPNIQLIQPCNAVETNAVVRYAVEESTETCAIRLIIGPSPRVIELPSDYEFRVGQGAILREGAGATLVAYGPVLLHEALVAADLLYRDGISVQVINMPWLNRADRKWLRSAFGRIRNVFVLEDHAPVGGLADFLLSELASDELFEPWRRLTKIGVEDFPAWGTPSEVLAHHRLDGASLSERVRAVVREPAISA